MAPGHGGCSHGGSWWLERGPIEADLGVVGGLGSRGPAKVRWQEWRWNVAWQQCILGEMLSSTMGEMWKGMEKQEMSEK